MAPHDPPHAPDTPDTPETRDTRASEPNADPTDLALGDPADDATQSAVRDRLAAQPDPGPMPVDIERRISGVLGRAGEVRISDRELFDELGLVEEPIDDDGDLIHFPGALHRSGELDQPDQPDHRSGTIDDESGPHTPGSSRDPVVLLRRRWPLLAAAAAAIALLAFAGMTLFGSRTGNDGLASLPGPSAAASPTGSLATSVAGRLHVQSSGTAYAADTLASQARDLVTTPGPEVGADQAAALGALATPDGANACVAALGDADAPAVTIDLATFAGQPAAVVVISRADKTTAYAVQRGCATGDPEVIKDAVPVP